VLSRRKRTSHREEGEPLAVASGRVRPFGMGCAGSRSSAPWLPQSSKDLRQRSAPLRCHSWAVEGKAQGASPGGGTLTGGRAVGAWPAGERLANGPSTASQALLGAVVNSSAAHGVLL